MKGSTFKRLPCYHREGTMVTPGRSFLVRTLPETGETTKPSGSIALHFITKQSPGLWETELTPPHDGFFACTCPDFHRHLPRSSKAQAWRPYTWLCICSSAGQCGCTVCWDCLLEGTLFPSSYRRTPGRRSTRMSLWIPTGTRPECCWFCVTEAGA